MSDEKKEEVKEAKYELKVSRMSPFDTYEVGAVALMLAEALERASDFQHNSDEFAEQAKRERIKAKELQALIKKLHERDKKRAAKV